MKNRILPVLVVIALLVTVGIVAAQAQDTTSTPEKIRTDGIAVANAGKAMSFPYTEEGAAAVSVFAPCPVCGGAAEKEWVPVSTTDTKRVVEDGIGHIYIDCQKLDLGSSYLRNAGGAAHIFLNGSNITSSYASYTIASSSDGMSIIGNGTVTNTGNGKAVYCYANTTNVYGGTYTSSSTSNPVMNPHGVDAVINIFGGNVIGSGDYALETSMGGNFNIYDGTISRTGDLAALISSNASTRVSGITMYGGSITGGVKLDYSGSLLNIHGGLVDAATVTKSTATLTGGTVGTLTASGGSVVIEQRAILGDDGVSVTGYTNPTITSATVTGATLSLSGTPTITMLDLTEATKLPVTVGTLNSGTSIGINVDKSTVFGSGATTDYSSCFSYTADSLYKVTADANYDLSVTAKTFETAEEIIDYANNHMRFPTFTDEEIAAGQSSEGEIIEDLQSPAVSAYCPICKTTRSWVPALNAIVNDDGHKHVYMAKSQWTVSGLYTGSGQTHLHWNNVTVNSNADTGVLYSDTAGQHSSAWADRGTTVMGRATLTQNNSRGYGLYANGGQLNVYGGTFTATEMFHSGSANSQIIVNGGTFTGNSTYSSGTLTINGGAIDGNIKAGGAATFNLNISTNLDLNGQTGVTVGGTGTVKVSDSKSKATVNDASSKYGTATITNTNAVAANNYIALAEEDNTVGFHYYEASMPSVALRTQNNEIGMYFNGVWTMDSKLREVADIGVVIGLNDNVPNEGFYDAYLNAASKNDNSHKYFFYDYKATAVSNGTVKPSVLVKGIMKNPNDALQYEENSNRGKNVTINGAAYIHIPAQDILVVSDPVAGKTSQTVYSALDLFDNNESKFTANKDALNALYTKWQGSMEEWGFKRIGVER